MSTFRKITPRDKPDVLAKHAASHEALLKHALRIATSRASRSNATIRALFASATVEGLARKLNVKAATISFTAKPFRGGLHQIYPWQILEDTSAAELARDLSWSLRESLKQKHKGY